MQAIENQLFSVGLAWKDPEYELWCKDEEKYTSELRIKLFRNREIDDILEFHIYKDGKAMTSEDEVDQWLRQQVQALTAGRKK